jgi:hypothetical protein
MSSIISCTVSDSLSGKLIVLGVTGSIAAVRTVDLVRDLIRRGATVHSVMSEAATEIIHPYALEYASENPVVTKITGRVEGGPTSSSSPPPPPTPSVRSPRGSTTPPSPPTPPQLLEAAFP